MGSTLTQRNTTVSLCLTFLAFNALICTMYGAPMASCGWSLNTLPLPIPTLSTTYLKTLATQNVASLIMALSPNGLLCLINMQLTSAERAGLSHPYHRCYGMERTAEHELNNFAVKQRLEADILILQNTTTLLGHAEQYDRNHNNKISEGIRNAREQLEDIRRGLTEMTDLLAQQEALTNGVDKDSCILRDTGFLDAELKWGHYGTAEEFII
ncbi:hypothetical protein EMCRGX_G031768 [Ephydatia muelleri]